MQVRTGWRRDRADTAAICTELPTTAKDRLLRKQHDFAVTQNIDPTAGTACTLQAAVFDALRPTQFAWLAAAVISVSVGYGALMPVLPGWLGSMMPGAGAF